MADIRILLLEADAEAAGPIAGPLERQGRTVTRIADTADAAVHGRDHQLLIIDVVADGADAVDVCRELRGEAGLGGLPFLCISQSDDVEERIRFLEAGADDVMAKPFDERELEARVDALLARHQRTSLASGGERQVGTRGSRVIAVFSPKGGVGTTTIAVNLACAVAAKRPDQVAIVDLDLGFGQVATHLNLNVRQTVVEVLRDELAVGDPDALRPYLVRHSSGVLVLAAPAAAASFGADGSGGIAPASISELLATLSRTVEVVIVDAGSDLDARTQAILEGADSIVLPVTPDFPALKAVHALLDDLNARGIATAKTTFVLNSIFARDLLRQRDIEEALGTKISLDLPYDGFLYLTAVNEGVPIVVGAPRSKPAERIERLAGMLLGEVAARPAEEKKGGGFKLFGRG